MIEVRGLVFEYPGTRALDGVRFEIEPASITALVGPNGAGKTTLLRCLAALETPIAGTIHLDGVDVLEDPRGCHRQVGYLSDFFGLHDDLTAEQCLSYAEAARGKTSSRENLDRVAEKIGLGGYLEVKAGALSRGLRQRLAIAQAIIHSPKVVLLDEPASGLDPEARATLANLFLELQKEGMTLMVSSHILTELDQYSSHLMILDKGRVVEHRRITDPKDTGRRLRATFAREIDGLAALLIGEGVSNLAISERIARFSFQGDDAAQHRLLASWLEAGLPVCALQEERENLQDAYLLSLQSHANRGPTS